MSAATDAAASALQTYKPLDSGAAISSANDQYGVGEGNARLSALKGIVGNLQSSVEAVDPSVTGRTSGTFTTEGQRSALVSKEQAPILGSLNKQQGALSSEQADVTQKQGLASAMASALLSDDKTKYQRLLDTYNQSTAQDSATESKRQYEQDRQDKINAAALTAKQSAVKSTSSASSTAGYSAKKDSNGGTQFTYKGAPVTAAQYYSAIGNSNDLANFLKNDKNSAAAYKDYNSGKYTYDQLAKKYSYIFGGV